ncbi:hypothetical protein [Pseudodesulfovibrio sp. JC047]|uniref:hypothetical protein n=1 Tax=Pseudodesulfovibrio sp. JC047 TaxID=2683199 RepID=UPI0013D3C450|nr:hypothetical protein [Pseudodesulfovibrio sp. JC047]
MGLSILYTCQRVASTFNEKKMGMRCEPVFDEIAELKWFPLSTDGNAVHLGDMMHE